MLKKLIEQSGFNHTEAEILSLLIEEGPRKASQISVRLDIKRPTVYAILAELLDQGMVTKAHGNGVAVFSAIEPSSFVDIIKNRAEVEHEKLKESAGQLKKLLSALPQRSKGTFAGLEIETIETMQGAYAQLYTWLMRGSFRAAFNPQLVINSQSRPHIKDFLDKTAKSRPALKEIIVRGPACDWYKANIRNPNHELREVREQNLFPSDLFITTDTVAILDYQPHTAAAISIRHPHFSRSLKDLFDIAWGLLEKEKTTG